MYIAGHNEKKKYVVYGRQRIVVYITVCDMCVLICSDFYILYLFRCTYFVVQELVGLI